MFKNHLKVAWRSLKRQPFFTFLNIFGLAIGMAGVLLISLYIHSELSHDSMFADAERIHRINAHIKFGGDEAKSGETSAPMAAVLQRDFSQVELATRVRNLGVSSFEKAKPQKIVKRIVPLTQMPISLKCLVSPC